MTTTDIYETFHKMSKLHLVRHGQSVWNLAKKFTGWTDVDLTEQGILEAQKAGEEISKLSKKPDIAYTSALIRAQKTLDEIIKVNDFNFEVIKNEALNERHYGDLQGKNKDEMRAEFGEEQVHIWRRSYDVSPPNGESLKQTAERTLPYFKEEILPKLEQGMDVLIVAHGNSLRSIIMYTENMSPEDIVKQEVATGELISYDYTDGKFTKI